MHRANGSNLRCDRDLNQGLGDPKVFKRIDAELHVEERRLCRVDAAKT